MCLSADSSSLSFKASSSPELSTLSLHDALPISSFMAFFTGWVNAVELTTATAIPFAFDEMAELVALTISGMLARSEGQRPKPQPFSQSECVLLLEKKKHNEGVHRLRDREVYTGR